MSAARLWLLSALALFGLWLLLVGTLEWLELVAGACASALAAAALTVAQRKTGKRLRVEPRELAGPVTALLRAVPETAVVLASVARGRPHGRFRTVSVPARGHDATSTGRRLLVTAVGTLPPNTVVVDVDAKSGLALVHDLDARRARAQLP
jgi:multisubunit Na+/H+ antiporter MnhE subunit